MRALFLMKMKFRIERLLLALCIVTVAGGLSSCARDQREKKNGGFLDDKVTTARVRAALESDPAFTISQMQVTTSNGIVTLRGSVKNSSEKEKAGSTARKAARARKVENELEVTAQ